MQNFLTLILFFTILTLRAPAEFIDEPQCNRILSECLQESILKARRLQFQIAAETKSQQTVLYVRKQIRFMPHDGLGVVPKQTFQFLLLKSDQTAYRTIPRKIPIHNLTLKDLPARYRGVWAAQQVDGKTYVLIRWEKGGHWQLEALSASLRDKRGEFQVAAQVPAAQLPGIFQAETFGQAGPQSGLSASIQAQQQYQFFANGTFQQIGYAGMVGQEPRASIGGTSQSVKYGTWRLYNYDLVLYYSDSTTRYLKIYRLADGWYINKLRFRKIQ
jgi:hypothetical protein